MQLSKYMNGGGRCHGNSAEPKLRQVSGSESPSSRDQHEKAPTKIIPLAVACRLVGRYDYAGGWAYIGYREPGVLY
jgi:hypothetical protein